LIDTTDYHSNNIHFLIFVKKGVEVVFMKEKLNENLGALIDLSQIKDGKELKRIIKEFDNLETSVKHQINVAFNKKFNALSKKYENLEAILNGQLDALEDAYASKLHELSERITEHEEYSERTYMKKTDLIGLENLSEDLREKIYYLLSNSSDESGFTTDYNGDLKKIKWSMYFILFADKILYLKDVNNRTFSSEKTVSWEDWYGENYEDNDFSSNCVELWMYDRPAESYLPLFYLPVTGDFDNSINYYYLTNGIYGLWNNANYNANTWETDRTNLYYFDSTSYENELIKLIEKNNYSKTYVLRNLGEYGEFPNEKDAERVEPICGKVSYNGDAGRFTFDNSVQSRYVFKLVKYEY